MTTYPYMTVRYPKGDGVTYSAIGVSNPTTGAAIAVRLQTGAGYGDPIDIAEVDVLSPAGFNGGGDGGGGGTPGTNTVTTETVVNGAITTDKIASGAVTTSKLGDGAVFTAKIANSAVTSDKIADGAITSAKISDGAISDGDINANANIAVTKLAAGAINTWLSTDGSGVIVWDTLPGGGVGDYTDEQARDAIGAALTNSSSIQFLIDDAGDSISAEVIFGDTAGSVAEGNDPRFAFISRSDLPPSSPAAGDLWLRYFSSGFSSFDEMFVYVTAAGANAWRSTQRKTWDSWASGSPPAQQFFTPVSGKSWWLNFAVTALVSTTNNSSNYWTIYLRSLNASSGVVQTLATVSTQSWSAGAWTSGGGLINDGDGLIVDTGGTERIIVIQTAATGSPGALTYAAEAAWRRQYL